MPRTLSPPVSHASSHAQPRAASRLCSRGKLTLLTRCELQPLPHLPRHSYTGTDYTYAWSEFLDTFSTSSQPPSPTGEKQIVPGGFVDVVDTPATSLTVPDCLLPGTKSCAVFGCLFAGTRSCWPRTGSGWAWIRGTTRSTASRTRISKSNCRSLSTGCTRNG